MTSNIWLLQTGEPLPLDPDVRLLRTGLIAEKLVRKGHQVRWWVSGFEHQRKKQIFQYDQEIVLPDGLILQVLCGCGYKKNISFARYFDHLQIALKFKKIAPQLPKPDILVISTPCYLLAYEGACYARALNIPFIVDVRDLWPDIFIDMVPGRFLKKIARTFLWRDYQKNKYLLHNADGVTAMSETVLKWALRLGQRNRSHKDQVFYLGYKKNKPLPVKDLRTSTEKQKKCIVFVGTFGISYELSLLLEAAKYFQMQGKGGGMIQFIFAGDGEQRMELEKKAADLKNVTLTGWLGEKDLHALLNNAWAGIIPCKSVAGAIPNKTFEYLSFGVPVLSSLEGEMAGKIEEFKIGINYNHGDLNGLCEAIQKITEYPEMQAEMSRNSIFFFERFGNADSLYNQYSDYIESFLN